MTDFLKFSHLLLGISYLFLYCGCGNIQERIDKDSKIIGFLQKSCNCDDISIASESENGNTNINCKMIGCQFSTVERFSDSLISGLENEIPNICNSTEQLNFIYINKGESASVSYIGCKKIDE
jgi:hypothetical protein